MKAKLSDRDWTLVAGIVVALIVAITIFFISPGAESNQDASLLSQPTSSMLNNLLKGITSLGKYSIGALSQLLSGWRG